LSLSSISDGPIGSYRLTPMIPVPGNSKATAF
jgi:hypothetical protein